MYILRVLESPGRSWTLYMALKGSPALCPVFHGENSSYFHDEEPASCSPLAPSEAGKEKLPHRLPHASVTPQGLLVLVRGTLALSLRPSLSHSGNSGEMLSLRIVGVHV